jgi:hypothetical protein
LPGFPEEKGDSVAMPLLYPSALRGVTLTNAGALSENFLKARRIIPDPGFLIHGDFFLGKRTTLCVYTNPPGRRTRWTAAAGRRSHGAPFTKSRRITIDIRITARIKAVSKTAFDTLAKLLPILGGTRIETLSPNGGIQSLHNKRVFLRRISVVPRMVLQKLRAVMNHRWVNWTRLLSLLASLINIRLLGTGQNLVLTTSFIIILSSPYVSFRVAK